MKSDTRIIILQSDPFNLNEEQVAEIKNIGRELGEKVVIDEARRDNVSQKQLQQADIIFGWPEAEQIAEAENLQWLNLPSAGTGNFIETTPGDVLLTNSSGVFGIPIAEHVLSLMFALSRNLHYFAEAKAENRWDRKSDMKEVFNSTVGIVGFGDIGSEVGRRVKALGCRVLGIKRHPQVETPDYVDELWGNDGLDLVLKESDYLVLSLPLTDETEGIIDADRLHLLSPSSFVINVGRGAVVDEKELVSMLQNNELAGAGLDVFAEEPLPADHPLWDLENVIITPHVSGRSPVTAARQAQLFCDNLKNFLRGEQLFNQVDRELGY